MAIETSKIQYGGDIMLFVNSTPMAFATGAKIDISTKTRDIGSKDSGKWDEKAVGKMSWTASSDALMADSNLVISNPIFTLTGAVSITSGTNALTVVGAGFVAGDVGRKVQIIGAGAAGADLITTIATYVSATQVTLTHNAGTTLTAVASKFVWNVSPNTAAITSGSTTLTMGSATFAATDVGKAVTILGAGVGGLDLNTIITGYTSPTVVTLQTAASTTLAATANKFVWNEVPNGYAGLYTAMAAGLPISLIFATATGTAPSWTVSAASGKVKFSGYGFITSLSLNAPDGDNATYSVSIEGTGPLSMV